MKDRPPRVLSTVYRHGLQTFEDLLVDLICTAMLAGGEDMPTAEDGGCKDPSSRQRSDKNESGPSSSGRLPETEVRVEARKRIIKESDSGDFVGLLKNSYAVMSESAPTLGPVSFEQRWTQQQIVERVIVLQFRQEPKPSHVLCSGFRKLRPSTSVSSRLRAPQGFECMCENSSVEVVNSNSWKILLSRVGDLVMLHLLSHAAIFCPLPNNCFLQISGVPASTSASIWRKFPSLHPGEKILGGLANKKWMPSGLQTRSCFVRNEGKKSQVDDKGVNCTRNPQLCRTSDKSSRFERKRPRICDSEARSQTEIPERCEGKLARKRRRYGHGEQKTIRRGGILSPEIVDASNTCPLVSGKSVLQEVDAKHSVASFPNQCSKRHVTDQYALQHPKRLRLNDKNAAADSLNQYEGLKSPEMFEDGIPCQHKMLDNKLSEFSLSMQRSVSIRCSNPGQFHGAGIIVHCPSIIQATDNASRSRKRTRPPSWKRRKLRQAQESGGELLFTNLTSVSRDSQLGSAQQIAEQQEGRCTKAGDHKSKSHLSELYHSEATDGEDLSRCQTSLQRKDDKKIASGEPPNVAQKRKSMNDRKRSAAFGRLIDRAPIFYNSNFSCRPGLPAKHILNTSKPNNIGVTYLFKSIFGANTNILVCSCSGNHIYAENIMSKLKPGLRKSFTSINKLLKDLISNAKRCAFSRLLHRHCPLPDGFKVLPGNSQNLTTDPILQSKTPKTEHQDRHEDHQHDSGEDDQQKLHYADHGPEVEEIMRLWLGSNYEPSGQDTETALPSTQALEKAASSSCKDVEDVIKSFVGDKGFTEKTAQSDLISCHTSHNKVVGFLWAVCRSIIPQDMLGSLRSWRALRSSIANFVGLRRHEKFNVRHTLIKLQVSSFSWLAFRCKGEDNNISQNLRVRFTIEERGVQQKRLELWLYWLFTNLVVPTIRSHFYVTENENYRQNIFYYRKPVWARIRAKGLKDLMSKNYKKLSTKAVAQVLNSRVLGFSQIRLMPKRAGLRPIANLAAASQGILKLNIRFNGQATMPEGVENYAKHCSVSDSSRSLPKVWFSNRLCYELEPTICEVAEQYTSVKPDEKVFALHGKKDTTLVHFAKTTTQDFAQERLDASSIVDVPKIQKRWKKSVKFYFRSINSMLRDVHCCLKFEKEAHPDDLGSSVFGYCDIHAKVLPFILHLKSSLNGMPRLFMAVCDVAKAYDTIQQDKLHEIIESFVQVSNYHVARYTYITPTLASIRPFQGRTCTLDHIPSNLLHSLQGLADKRSHCIFTDQAHCTSVRREQVIAVLGEHVKQNIVQIGSHFYQQTVGIPQGSVLSSLLCSLFYGHYDEHCLLPLLQPESPEMPGYFLNPDSSVSRCEGSEKRAKSDSVLTSVFKASGLIENEVENMLELSLVISNNMQDHGLASKPSGLTEDEVEKMLELSLVISDNMQDHGLSSKPSTEFRFPSESIFLESGNLDHQDNEMHSNATVSRGKSISTRDSVLLRLIDDSFFISTSETAVRTFVENMHRGSEEYGCHANERKTAVNFDLCLGNATLPRKVYESEDGACFMRWSGLLINCYTLEFQADYTRYVGEHIRSTLTVRREGHQGWQLVLKMCQYMRPKCHALFFDPRINSPATIRLNAFQAFLLCAMKFHAYVCCLPPVTGSNEPFLHKAIVCATRYMYSLLRHKMETVGARASAFFPFKELEWLALVAFDRVLKRKQARYPILLRTLQTELQMQKYDDVRTCPHVLSATDERKSSMFKFIKY